MAQLITSTRRLAATHRIADTIVEGQPLAAPPAAIHRTIDGIALAEYRDDHGHDIVAFQRHSVTCVLSAT